MEARRGAAGAGAYRPGAAEGGQLTFPVRMKEGKRYAGLMPDLMPGRPEKRQERGKRERLRRLSPRQGGAPLVNAAI